MIEPEAEVDDAARFRTALSAACAGDERAFAEIWRANDPRLRRFLSGLVSNDDVADLSSTVWLEVVRRLDSFDGDAAGFRAWIFTIARSRVVDLHRSRRRRVATVSRDEEFDDHVGNAPDPLDLISDSAATDAAIALIGRLPEKQAEVVLLRVVADLDVETTARILEKEPGAVRVLAHRGLQRLAQLISEEGVTR